MKTVSVSFRVRMQASVHIMSNMLPCRLEASVGRASHRDAWETRQSRGEDQINDEKPHYKSRTQ